jgi:tRNA A-37 threonylcarbamoyl transferase component Bud32
VNPDPRLPDLFAQASELEGEAQAAWLAGLRLEDETLAREVAELLAASAADTGRFETPAWERLPPEGEKPAAPAPERVGSYRILREIGRGGMGRVFLAEQEEAAFRRTVALKVIDHPVVAEDMVRRFRDEVRILAGLEHPGIARFFDGGRAADGTWFLALEYVEGEDLLAFVRRWNLDLRARVELFLQVLEAVDFAHRRLVVHRDLKPANVLVDADGRARLLDFGISKIVDPDADDSLSLHTELRAFTPAYASPEQLRGERATVATDVYSLGVMLYEILAGRRPFARRNQADLGRDPEPPSTAARQPSAAPDDSQETSTLIRWRDLTGDLDAVTLKALRGEPESRYHSAAAFADDLRRWLAGEPVEAHRGGRRYRLAKFVARHRLSLSAATAICLALAAGFSAALEQRSRALAAQARAEATVADLHRLTQSMLFEIYEDVRELPNSLKVSDKVVRGATEALDRLAATAGDDPRLLADLASGYERLGSLFSPHPAVRRSLNQPRAALGYYERAVAIRQRLAARPAAGFADRLAFANSLGSLAQAQMNAGDTAGSVKSTREGIRRLAALQAEAPDPAALRFWLAFAYSQAWLRAQRAGDLPSVDAHGKAAMKFWLDFAAAPPSPAVLDEPEFIGIGPLGTRILQLSDYPEEALRINDLALAALDRGALGEPEGWLAANSRFAILNERIDALEDLNRPAEALAALKEMLRLRQAIPRDSDDLLSESITRIDSGQKAAELGARAGDFAFADRSIADAERAVAEAEGRWGEAAFASARVELEWTQAKVFERRAERSASRDERRRMLAAALERYRAAMARAERLGNDVHGIPPDRLANLRGHARRIQEELQP